MCVCPGFSPPSPRERLSPSSGASYQGLFRNPMASPDLLGATAGASFGAALGIILSLGTGGIELLSFLCGLGAVFLTWIIGRKGGDSGRTVMLILGGMLVSTLFTSLITLIKYTADPYGKLPQITYWLMGSLASVTPREGLLLLAVVTAASLPLYLLRWRLNVLAFDDEEARTLGLDVTALRVGVIILATLMTSAVVSSAGQIGWVGLLVPPSGPDDLGPGLPLPASRLPAAGRDLPASHRYGGPLSGPGGNSPGRTDLLRRGAPVPLLPVHREKGLVMILVLKDVSCGYGEKKRGEPGLLLPEQGAGPVSLRTERGGQIHPVQSGPGADTLPGGGNLPERHAPGTVHPRGEGPPSGICSPDQAGPPFPSPWKRWSSWGASAAMGRFAGPGREDRKAAAAALEEMGIASLAGRIYTRLSGGEQQAVLLAGPWPRIRNSLLWTNPFPIWITAGRPI